MTFRVRPALPLRRPASRLLAVAALASAAGGAHADVYTCVDAQGRRLTADRPILSCLDREQRVLDNTGATKRILQPQMTAIEREQHQARERQAELDRQRARDSIRRDQALLNRYPDKAAHDEARAAALAQSQVVLDVASTKLQELLTERKALNQEMEFYQKDPSRAPAQLRRQIEDNAESTGIQRQAIARQQAERDKINERFDKELAYLRQLWEAARQPTSARGG